MVQGFNLPLPQGKWEIIAATPFAGGTSIYLGRIERNRLQGAVLAFAWKTKELPGTGNRSFAGVCESSMNYQFIEINNLAGLQLSCWGIHPYHTLFWHQWADSSVNMGAALRSAASNMATKGISFPQEFVVVRLHRTELWGALEASYFFSPETEGIATSVAPTPKNMDWNIRNIDRFPEKLAYIAKLKEWGTSMWPKFKLAFSEAE